MSEGELTTGDYIFHISMILLLTIITATSQGLLIAFLSIDPLEIELTMHLDDEEITKQARKVFPILQKHYLLLVTLLYIYVICVVLFPLFLNKLVPPMVTIPMSIILVLFFGEIVPGAVCTGPNQIKIASKLVTLVKLLLFLFYPLSKPFAIFLEYCFKRDESKKRYTIKDFKALIDIHTCKAMILQKQYVKKTTNQEGGSKAKQ